MNTAPRSARNTKRQLTSDELEALQHEEWSDWEHAIHDAEQSAYTCQIPSSPHSSSNCSSSPSPDFSPTTTSFSTQMSHLSLSSPWVSSES